MQSMSVTKRPSAIITAVFAMVMTAASCRRDNDFNAETNLPQTVSNDISAGVATASPDIKRDSPVSPQGTYYHSEFIRLVASSNMTAREVACGANDLCREICNTHDAEESARLLDLLLEMAVEHHIDDTVLYSRQIRYRYLWNVAMNAFCFAQEKHPQDFKYWDRLFRFYDKYINEIKAVECSQIKTYESNRYLLGIKDDFKMWLHVMRDLYFPRLSQGLTEEQKSDILRRFDELQKYTAEPPDCHGRKVESK